MVVFPGDEERLDRQWKRQDEEYRPPQFGAFAGNELEEEDAAAGDRQQEKGKAHQARQLDQIEQQIRRDAPLERVVRTAAQRAEKIGKGVGIQVHDRESRGEKDRDDRNVPQPRLPEKRDHRDRRQADDHQLDAEGDPKAKAPHIRVQGAGPGGSVR